MADLPPAAQPPHEITDLHEIQDAFREAARPFQARLQEFAEYIQQQPLSGRRAEQAKSLALQVQMAIEAIEDGRADWAARHTYELAALVYEFSWEADVLLGRRDRRNQAMRAKERGIKRRADSKLPRAIAIARQLKIEKPDLSVRAIARIVETRTGYKRAYLVKHLGPILSLPTDPQKP